MRPNPGDTWTVGSKTYIWNGTAWIVQSTNSSSFGTITVTTTTNATGTNSGALIVTGGVGIGGDLYIGGNLYAGGQQILTTSSFNAILNEGPDIQLTITTGSVIVISNTSTLQTVTSRGSSTNRVITITNTTPATDTSTGALVVSGGVGIGGDVWVQGKTVTDNVQLPDCLIDTGVKNLYTIDGNGPQLIDSYSLNDYRSSKYFVQVKDGMGTSATFHTEEIIVSADNSGTAFISRYSIVATNGTLGEFTASINTTNMELFFIPDYATDKTLKMYKVLMST